MRYNRDKFKELEDLYMYAYSYNQTDKVQEERLYKELKQWKLNDLKDEFNFYNNPYKPGYGFMEFIKYYIKDNKEENNKPNKEEDYINYLLNNADKFL